jgi:hypothetical protein
MKLLIAMLLNVLAFAIMPAVANAEQPLTQDPVAFEQDHFMKRCGGQASFGEHFATQEDFNNDKLTDIVINEGEITCKGEKGPDCTDEGCVYNFYVHVQEGGYIMIATARMYGYDFVQRFGNMVLAMKMHPKYCNRTDGDPCLMTVRVRGTEFVTISAK